MPEPIRISWSQMRNHEECKQKSYLLRSHKRAKSQNIRSYFHGMVVDVAMREWLDDPWRTQGDMASKVDRLMTKVADDARDAGDGIVRWKSPGDREELRSFCLDLVGRLEPILDQLVTPYTWTCGYRFTAPFVADGIPIVLVGEMDLLVQHPEGYRIWDLKATRDDQYWRKVLGQLMFYDCALQILHRSKSIETGLIQPMCKEPVMRFTLDDDARREMWARILRMAADIRNERRECKTGTDNCQWCEVKHACARYVTLPGDGLATALRSAANETG